MEEFFLNPGELVFTNKPYKIKTILGSCVSVIIYDRSKKFCGMCHYLLPYSIDNGASTKYGDVAIPLLIKKFYKNNSKKSDLEAIIVGGALIFENQNEIFFIGDKNVEIAKKLLNKYRIFIKDEDSNGDKGRTIIFNTTNGKLTIRRHRKFNLSDVLDRIRKKVDNIDWDMIK
ncbi:MAG: hypothetical protein A2086_03885 [Spirochaetes bacterium GWD1_27_9]|nr:MAG: hypothetical protein A2Z98_01470 [Spirochaetes bacterium GWB1_27_13]OHD24332.1 MAG: hypothetical protein A2Y34_05210 [Spirochaetes bacterium GWC1_27_15]OHD36153.1 MAG: hypothetical protein A2086_03885 [Spirochaetes bacterium GWD1_27_9]